MDLIIQCWELELYDVVTIFAKDTANVGPLTLSGVYSFCMFSVECGKVPICSLSKAIFKMVVVFTASISSTNFHKNNETNEKFYRKVAFLICRLLILGLKAETKTITSIGH